LSRPGRIWSIWRHPGWDSIKVDLDHTHLPLHSHPLGVPFWRTWSVAGYVANCMLVALQQICAAQNILLLQRAQCCAYAMYARCCWKSLGFPRVEKVGGGKLSLDADTKCYFTSIKWMRGSERMAPRPLCELFVGEYGRICACALSVNLASAGTAKLS